MGKLIRVLVHGEHLSYLSAVRRAFISTTRMLSSPVLWSALSIQGPTTLSNALNAMVLECASIYEADQLEWQLLTQPFVVK